MKTWKLEMLVVFVVLGAVVAFTGHGWLEVLGALAVLAAFGNAQVTLRMAETEAAKPKPDVDCHNWAGRYFFAKELLWLAYFVAHKSWAALVGVAVFLLYPWWRLWWRKRHPVNVEVAPGFTIEELRPGEKPVPFQDKQRPAWAKPPTRPPDRLLVDGHAFEVLEGTTLTPGSPWVIRAKVLLGAGDQKRLDELITNHEIVQAELLRYGADPVHGEVRAARGGFFRDREGRNCGSLELIGTKEVQYG